MAFAPAAQFVVMPFAGDSLKGISKGFCERIRTFSEVEGFEAWTGRLHIEHLKPLIRLPIPIGASR